VFRFKDEMIDKEYRLAKEIYGAYGVNTDETLEKLAGIHISLNCWQGDDVTGFEPCGGFKSGTGIMATGNYPGKAGNGEELRNDLEMAMSLIPGKHRVNLHAIYAETKGKKIERDELETEHFRNWIDWAKKLDIGLDFNPTFFAHERCSSGFTLSSREKSTRDFWIKHGKSSRKIAQAIGYELGKTSINNFWIPDGSKDLIADRLGHRVILKDALDEIFVEKIDRKFALDAVESKLFGIGSESYVVGSHEFYLSYALKNGILLCLDMGHFHPTESVADKISSILLFQDSLLLHISRGLRWDSDHVVILNEELQSLMNEIKRSHAFGHIHFALDFFDASINRLSAWIIGARSTLKSMLFSMLEPTAMLLEEEKNRNFGNRLALLEEFKTLPFPSVWHKYCAEKNVPVGTGWLEKINLYEKNILSKRK
jgi:L-rhamnose isomerase